MVESLAYYITLLRKDFSDYCGSELQKLGLSQGQLFFLLYVGKHPGCAPRELAGALRMDTGHVTRTLAKLEQGGFLRQETNTADRRARILTLEPKGEDAFCLSHALFTRWDGEVLAGMEAGERTALLATLRALAEREEETCHVRYDVQPH